MQILSTTRPVAANPKNPSGPSAKPEKTDITPQDIVTKGAYLTGGALGGVGVGVVTGKVMSDLTGISMFSSVGGVAGALGGAASAYALSGNANKKEALVRVSAGWVGGSLGSAAGQFVLGKAGEALVAAGASSYLGAAGPLVGTLVGGLGGASLPMSSDTKTGKLMKRVAVSSLAATAGTYGGGLAQSLLATNVPALSTAAALAPVVGGLAAGSIAHSYTIDSRQATAAAYSGGFGAAGFGAGLLAGGLASTVTGSAFYTAGLPVIGMAAGALLGGGAGLEETNRSQETDSRAEKFFAASGTIAGAGVGAAIGDAVGHGLQMLTGNSIYAQAGMAVGGVNGLLGGLSMHGIDTHKVAPTVAGATAGVAGGALLGHVLSAISGQQIWGTVLPVLGGAAGGLSCLAATFQQPGKAEGEKQQG